MSYRGRDLDLYTSEQGRTFRTAGRTGARGPAFQRGTAEAYSVDHDAGGEDQGLLVDDAVLAVCNHAYDLAVAHRSAEVRLEHLLNAMTRTDAAVAVMSALGIDVAGLRYDTASAIAAQEAMISGNERNLPRRSQDLADTLQLAAERARARRSSVSVADVLHILFELNRERPGLDMLKRNAPGWQPRTFSDAPRPDPLPPLIGGYQSEPRYAPQPIEPPREYQRVQEQPYYQPQQTAYYLDTTLPSMPAGGSVTDVVQNSRLDQLERTIRELSGELMAERKAFSQLVTDLKRDVLNHNDTATRMRGGLDERLAGIEQMVQGIRQDDGGLSADRLAGLERSVDSKFADLARGWTVLGERLQSLESAVSIERPPGAAVELVERLQGLDDLARTMTSFNDRMAGLERQIAGRPPAPVVDLQPIVDRLVAIENAERNRPAAIAALLAPVMEKLAVIETAANEPIGTDLSPLLEHLNMIDSRVADVGRDAVSYGDRIAQFERKIDSGAERFRPIEDAIASQRDQLSDLATNLAADVKAIGQMLTAQGAASERIQSVVGERFQSLGSAMDRQRAELVAAMTGPLNERAGRVEELVETYRDDLTGQMTAIEKQIEAFGRRTIDLHEAHGKDIVELHDEIVKLNTNQHTLASSLDQSRLDISSKLEGIERSSVKPLEIMETVNANVAGLQRIITKRDERRSRLQHWLMGTDDWYAASWEFSQIPDKGVARNGATPGRIEQSAKAVPVAQPVNRSAGPIRG